MAAKNFMNANPLTGKAIKTESTNVESNKEEKKTVTLSENSQKVKGRPKTKTGYYKKVNVSIEENDLQLYKALADKRCGGNLTLLINQLLKEAVEKDN